MPATATAELEYAAHPLPRTMVRHFSAYFEATGALMNESANYGNKWQDHHCVSMKKSVGVAVPLAACTRIGIDAYIILED